MLKVCTLTLDYKEPKPRIDSPITIVNSDDDDGLESPDDEYEDDCELWSRAMIRFRKK